MVVVWVLGAVKPVYVLIAGVILLSVVPVKFCVYVGAAGYVPSKFC